MSKFVYVILSLMLCLSTSNHVFAAETVEHDPDQLRIKCSMNHKCTKNNKKIKVFVIIY